LLEDYVLLAPLLVTTTADNGSNTSPTPGSLRAEIIAANALTGSSEIDFSISGSGPQTIKPPTALPNVTKPVFINGASQPLYAGTPLIVLDGSLAPSGTEGLHYAAGSGSGKISAIELIKFPGITLELSSGGNTVTGCYIGTDASGHTGLGNGTGVGIDNGVSGNIIGGTSPGAANVIASSSANGFNISDLGTTGNVVEGNFIGTDASSHTGLGNGVGVSIFGGASGNTIGGTSTAAANVIAGSAAAGIGINGTGTTGNVVEGNFIGTDSSSHTGLGNNFGGVGIGNGASGNTIGGTSAGAANVIVSSVVSGADGVFIGDSGTTGNVVEGNFIGTDASGHTGLGNGGSGVVIGGETSVGGASGNTIGGTSAAAANVIASNAVDGIGISGSSTTGNVVEGNYIGTDASSHTGLGNTGDGVDIESGASGNTIGGTSPGAANVIAENGFDGISLFDSGTTGNVIEGNFIGTDASSHTGLGNGFIGVDIESGPSGNTIGGTSAAAANVIASNAVDGIFIGDSGTTGNVIEGNFIGTDASSHMGLGNTGDGVDIESGASGNTIGGTSPGAANVLASNSLDGVFIGDFDSGTGTTGNVIEGNFIGTDSSSHTGLGNGEFGVNIVEGASGNTVGGTASSTGNVIAFNQKGVVIGDSTTDSASGNAILGNSIFSNALLGIDLGNDGITQNDSQGHTGPNLFQDFPVLSTAEIGAGGGTTITGTVTGPKSSTATVALYANTSAGASGYGQGQMFLGFVLVPIGAGGTGSFSFGTTAPLTTGEFVSATATDAGGNTSEFAKDLAIVQASDNVTSQVTISSTGFSVNRRTLQYTQTITITNTSGATIAGPIYLELANLPSGVTLVSPNSTPTSSANPPSGSPAVLVSSGALGNNQSITVTLVFSDPSNVVINYIPQVLSNPRPL